jgi:hypothetical protein
MKKQRVYKRLPAVVLFLVLILSATNTLVAQGITTYQYRRVPSDKQAEFIKRETTYWSKVAQKAIDNGTLTFWGLF